MKLRQSTLALLIAAAFLGTSPARADDAAALTGEIQTMDASAANKGSSVVTGKIASDFESLAGSKQNATALVTGLRNGSEITLTKTGEPSATFTPATRPMGYGNVSTSLALARYQLAQQGITNPTPEQLKTALNGGAITLNGKTVEYQGVLQLRADGMGWGQIAQQSGTKLGPVVSGIKAQNAHIATLPAAKPATGSTATGVTTATGAAAGSAASTSGNRGSGDGKGIVTASGASSASSTGAAKGKDASGVTTAGGGASAPRGQGITTAAGQSASPAANGVAGGRGGGVVTASGASAGVTASGGGGQGNGKAVGLAK